MSELRLKQGLILTEDGKELVRVPSGAIRIRPLAQWLVSNGAVDDI